MGRPVPCDISTPGGRRFSRRLALAGLAGTATAAVVGGSVPASARTPSPTWVATWATAQVRPLRADVLAHAGFERQTVRQVITVTAGGPRLRLRLDNPYGRDAVTIGAVTVAHRRRGTAGASAGIDAGSVREVLFSGTPQAVLSRDGSLYSDPVEYPLDAGGEVVVSMYISAATGPLSFHRRQHATGFVAKGNEVRGTAEPYTTKHDHAFLLTAVEVEKIATFGLAVLGDSITEGVGTPLDANLRLTDQIAARFNQVGGPLAVANLGIGGNRLLHDHLEFGDSGLHRVERDVLSLSGVDAVLVALGVNDLRPSTPTVTARSLLSGYRVLVARARARGLRVGVATITPFQGRPKWSPALEAVRDEVNAEIRGGGLGAVVADFDAALRDPTRTARMKKELHNGDWLHPNGIGTAAMAAAFPEELVSRPIA